VKKQRRRKATEESTKALVWNGKHNVSVDEVVAIGDAVGNLRIGDLVVVPFTISCGECLFCRQTLFAACDVSNPAFVAAAYNLLISWGGQLTNDKGHIQLSITQFVL